jgi:DNA-binding response OmpR family regulator
MRNTVANEASALESPREIPQDDEKVRAPSVLVVDDERLIRWSIGETLSALGLTMIEAGDAKSALDVFDADIDLVLLDLHLPDSNGLSVLARMRRIAPSTPVIIMTAFATPTTADDAAAYGAPVLPKPFELSDLAARVRGALADRIY